MRDFWARVTEGRGLDQLGSQFVSDAKASYALYSKDVDWDEVGRGARGPRRIWRSAWALFQAMLMKLTPARRVLLLLAIALLLIQPSVRGGNGHEFNVDLGGFGVAILFLLLAVELADRVTMKRDLEIAREIQQWLVPDRAPDVPGVDIAFATRPQNTVAGDYYDAFLRPVVPQNSVTPPLLAATPVTLDDIVEGLDRYCRAHSLDGRRFTTAFLAQIDPKTREMVYVNAGHNDPILRRASGQIERLPTGGPPFGLPLFTDEPVPYPSGRVQLHPGDLLFIFTDGVVEAVNDAGEEYGEARLLPCVQNVAPETSDETLKRVMADVNAFVGYARQHDDITCLVLRVSA